MTGTTTRSSLRRGFIAGVLMGGVLLIGGCAEQGPVAATADALRSAGSGTPHELNTMRSGGAGEEEVGIFSHGGGAVIGNGVVQIGVNPQGHLNTRYTPDPLGIGYMGLRYVPTGAASTEPGCLCEGWGVADAISGIQGSANVDRGGIQNLTVESFTHDATTATSVTRVGTTFRVTHEYRPAVTTPNLYEVIVTVENISAQPVDLRYRRVMDWDIYPTAFREFVTIQGTTGATNVLFASNNGFAPGNPLSGPSSLGRTGDFVDHGPADHGALFDFGFGALAAGDTRTFRTFYGAASTEEGAIAALGAVGAEVYSFGQANVSNGPQLGVPNTFIFAFAGVGGTPIANVPPVADAGADQVVECSTSGSSVTLDGTGSIDDDGTIESYEWLIGTTSIATGATPTVSLDEGTHVIRLVVTDDRGAIDEDTVTVSVDDTQAPLLEVGVGSATLWPPNHKYHVVEVSASATDGCAGSIGASGITAVVVSNEADESAGSGDGNTTGDIRITRPDGTVLLSSNESPAVKYRPGIDQLEVRAERQGTAAPRVYTITFSATDAAGNVGTATATVTVTHDQR